MKSRTDLNLGDKVKDRISGFSGIVTARLEYLNGCLRMQVSPDKVDKEGKVPEGYIFDVEQLDLVKAGVHAIASPGGGPMPTPKR